MTRHLSDAYDPELTREDMGRPTRAEAERDAAEDRATTREHTPGPLTDAVRAERWWGE